MISLLNKLKPIVVILVFILLFSCSTTSVERVAADSQTDLSGYWNDTDSRLVAENMVYSLLNAYWIKDFTNMNGEKPRVIIGNISLMNAIEHIKTSAFIKDIERELINSGRVRFVANSEEREEIRDEKIDQQKYSSESTAARLAAEYGADYMLKGSITMYIDAVEGKKIKFYQVDLELIDIESIEKVWMDTKKIKKMIKRSKLSW